jgi:hypothetical protein
MWATDPPATTRAGGSRCLRQVDCPSQNVTGRVQW